jgi:predicted Zn-dependent protease
MAINDQSSFWDSIPTSLRQSVELAIPPQTLRTRLPPSSPNLASRYTQLEYLLKDVAAQDHLPSQTEVTSPAHISALFPLAMLYIETKDYAAAESTYRTLLSTSPSDLAAMSNLIEVLNLQHKYPEAQSLSMDLLPLLQSKLGEISPQSLGCMRELMLSLIGQNKRGEAREILERGMELVATIKDNGVRNDEEDAMQEIAEMTHSLT